MSATICSVLSQGSLNPSGLCIDLDFRAQNHKFLWTAKSLMCVMPGMWLNHTASYWAPRHSLNPQLGHLMGSEGPSQPNICKIQLWFCFPLSLASLLHLQVQCEYDQAVETATKQNDTLRSDQQLSGIYFFQAIILSFKLKQGAQHGHFIDWIREKLSWLMCMMTLSSCVCSYDRNKDFLLDYWSTGRKWERKGERKGNVEVSRYYAWCLCAQSLQQGEASSLLPCLPSSMLGWLLLPFQTQPTTYPKRQELVAVPH